MKRFVRYALLLVLLSGCVSNPASPALPVEKDPARGWKAARPEDQGLDTAMLADMRAAIRRGDFDLDSLLVVYKGTIVFEEYFGAQTRSSLHETFSVTKSFTSTLVGLAIAQGSISGVDARLVDLLPEEITASMAPELAEMTVEDLLTMRSGLDWQEGDPAYRSMYASRDWAESVLSLPPAGLPGEQFNYCSGCSHVLMRIVQEQVGMDAERFAREKLFEPLGINDYTWEKSAEGVPIGGWGLSLDARDMAKFGYLFLHAGRWNGQQVVPREWVETATLVHVDVRNGALDYGYQWWIDTGQDAFSAIGRGGQMIYVDPAHDLVVVTTSDMGGDRDPLDLVDLYIRPALPD